MKVKYCPYLDGDEPQANNTFHQENEKLRALCVAQEVEIARLQSGFDELKSKASEKSYFSYEWNLHGVRVVDLEFIEDEINRITGENK